MSPNEVDTDGLRTAAARYTSEVAPRIAEALTAIAAGTSAHDVQSSNFTNLHIPLALVYVEAYNFQKRNLESRSEDAATFDTNLRSSAKHWDDAEHLSTVKPEVSL